MNIIKTPDRVTLTDAELQILIKDHIQIKLGRIVDGEIYFSKSNDGLNRTSVYAHLVEKTNIRIETPPSPGAL